MFLDTSAWIEYFAGGTKGAQVRELMDRSGTLLSAPIVLAELFSKYARAGEAREAAARVAYVQENSAIVDATAEMGIEAGRLHAAIKPGRPKFGMADAFVLASARARNARLVTFDPDFRGLDHVDLLE